MEGPSGDKVPGSFCINHLEKPQNSLTSKDYLAQCKTGIRKKLNSGSEKERSRD